MAKKTAARTQRTSASSRASRPSRSTNASRSKKPSPSTNSSRTTSTFLGMPGSLRWPGWSAIGKNMWDLSEDAALFPPKVWGYGWSFNFAYPLIKSKPLWMRITAFSIGLLILLLILWACISLGVIIYYLVEAVVRPITLDTQTIVVTVT